MNYLPQIIAIRIVQETFAEIRTGGVCDDSYTLTRTWTATDNCGNNDVHTQVITVRDTKAPSFAGVPTDITVECDEIPDPANPQVEDNCDLDVQLDFSEIREDGDCNNTYTLIRKWTSD